uniref:Uncharacterized protein n=1 Tax=Vespula pensylvanica TaxID=30213 RepID=A0A834U8R4_VESPE|nr:hypothetical protein H0235_009954 [Vespula pensylvanica]
MLLGNRRSITSGIDPLTYVEIVKDLMTKNKRTNWRRLLAGGLVAIVALALVVAAAILLTGSPDSSASRTTSAPGISLEEWLAGSLSPKSFNATWLSATHQNRKGGEG